MLEATRRSQVGLTSHLLYNCFKMKDVIDVILKSLFSLFYTKSSNLDIYAHNQNMFLPQLFSIMFWIVHVQCGRFFLVV